MTEAMVIETPRLRLRPLAAKDWSHWIPFYASDHSRFVGRAKTEEEVWWKVAQWLGHWTM